ncbi:Tim44 domain-containing protein [Lacticaseibacillus sp. GG6-2]
MKKILVTLMLGLALIAAPTVSVQARAGGVIGGGHVHVTTGRSTGIGRSIYGGRGLHRGIGRGVYMGGAGLIVFVVVIGLALARRRRPAASRVTSTSSEPIDADLAKAFEPLFYHVEKAWSDNDQATLATLMTAKFYKHQKAILDRWEKQGKRNRLEDVVIIATAQERSDADHPHVVVTAQARDYIEALNQPAAVNQARRDQALLARFTEVWELAYAEDGRLLVAKIRQ